MHSRAGKTYKTTQPQRTSNVSKQPFYSLSTEIHKGYSPVVDSHEPGLLRDLAHLRRLRTPLLSLLSRHMGLLQCLILTHASLSGPAAVSKSTHRHEVVE